MQNISFTIPCDVMYEVKALPRQDAEINEKIQTYLAIGLFCQ